MNKRWLVVCSLLILVVFTLFAWKVLVPIWTHPLPEDVVPVSQSAIQDAISHGRIAQLRNADYNHYTSGQVLVLQEDNVRFLRLENFATSGSDISLFFAKNLSSTNKIFVDKLKSLSGNQNYNLSSEVDMSGYPYVLLVDNRSSTLYGWAKFE